MRKSFLLIIYFAFLSAPAGLSQLIISNGTRWVSDNATQAILDDLGFQYDGATGLLSNKFVFRGTGNSAISGATLPEFNSIEINKQGTAKLVLQCSIHILESINFQGGLFDLNSNNVTLAATALLNNENENSRFIGSNGGYISINVNLNAPALANPGNLGAIITSSQDLGLVTINRGHQSQVNNSGGGSSILRYYDILPAINSNLNATFRFHYFDAELNGLDENNLLLWKSNNNVNWTNMGFTSRNTAANYIEKTGIGDFSRWTLSPVSGALPVLGLKLTGIWRNNTSVLSWTTVAEYNNDHFDIERKQATETYFNSIAVVGSKHANGNSQSLTAYEYIDATANGTAGIILYRLKQVDKNGQYQYSNTIAVKPGAKKEFILTVYPTVAVNNGLFIQTGNLDLQKMQVQVFDMSGRLLVNRELSYQSQLLPLAVISKGMYRLVVMSGEWVYSCLFTKQ